MELIINLNKALNTSKLVKKPVTVKGKDGKTFTRMQWVDPNDASTGNGVRQIHNKEGFEQAKKDGIDKHPSFHEAMKHQQVHEDNMDNHKNVPFHLPETEESAKKHKGRLNPDTHSSHIPHEDKSTKHEGTTDLELDLLNPNIHNVTQNVVKDLDHYSNTLGFDETFNTAFATVDSHWHTIKAELKKHIEDTTEDLHARNMQLQALDEGDMNHIFTIGAHPHMAKQAVNAMLGKEKADIAREHMKDANLSINFNSKHARDISEKGYIASTDEDYLINNIGEHLDEYNSDLAESDYTTMKNEGKSISSIVSALSEEFPDVDYGFWAELETRATAEQDAIGLKLKDEKPTYVAFNPMNNPTGGASFYGQSWLKMNNPEDILHRCTVTMDDSFNTSRSFAKVHSMDHLKDIYLLKTLQKDKFDWGSLDKDTPEWGFVSAGMIPLELHLHQGKTDPSEFSIETPIPDPPKEEYYDLDIDDDEDLGDLIDDDDLDDLIDDEDLDEPDTKSKSSIDFDDLDAYIKDKQKKAENNHLNDLDTDISWDDILGKD